MQDWEERKGGRKEFGDYEEERYKLRFGAAAVPPTQCKGSPRPVSFLSALSRIQYSSFFSQTFCSILAPLSSLVHVNK